MFSLSQAISSFWSEHCYENKVVPLAQPPGQKSKWITIYPNCLYEGHEIYGYLKAIRNTDQGITELLENLKAYLMYSPAFKTQWSHWVITSQSKNSNLIPVEKRLTGPLKRTARRNGRQYSLLGEFSFLGPSWWAAEALWLEDRWALWWLSSHRWPQLPLSFINHKTNPLEVFILAFCFKTPSASEVADGRQSLRPLVRAPDCLSRTPGL